jgi:hypothetical protein
MTALPLSVADLRARLAAVEAPVPHEELVLPTGIAALDAALRGGGLPRGRVTELVGARSSGRTTMLRRIVAAVAARRMWVAYVDAGRTLAARDWAAVRGRDGDELWVIRPPLPSRAPWCADVLLRSGAFALVVLDGAPRLSPSVAVRLGRLARERGTALLVTADDEGVGSALPSAVRMRVARPPGRRGATAAGGGGTALVERRAIVIGIEKGGLRRRVEVSYDVGVASRLCAHPEVGDRRGRESRGRHAAAGAGGAAAGARPGGTGGARVAGDVGDAERAAAHGRGGAAGHPAARGGRDDARLVRHAGGRAGAGVG